jgi:nucleoid DNA-binding protein
VNKSGLIDAVSTTTSLNAVVHEVVSGVRVDHRASVVEFGTFNPTQRDVQLMRHPQASASMTNEVKASLPAPALKKRANQSTKKAVRRGSAAEAVGTPVEKISRCTRVSTANKAVRRAPVNRPAKYAPARKAAKLSAKKAVRRA